MKTALLFYFVTLCSAGFTGYDEEQWQKAADFLKEGYDSEADACNNFTRYSCGKWYEKKYTYPESAIHALHLYTLGIDAANKVDQNDNTTATYKKSVKFFLDYCGQQHANTTAANVYEEITKLLGSPTLFKKSKSNKFLKRNIWYLLGFVQRQFPMASTVLKVTVQPSYLIQSVRVAALHMVPNYKIMVPINEEGFENLTLQLASILNMNIDEKKLSKKINDMAELEAALSKLLNDSEKAVAVAPIKNFILENRWNTTNVFLASDLPKLFPNISWTDFFQGLFTADQYHQFNASFTFIDFEETEFFFKINQVLESFDKETVFNYVFFNVYQSSLSVISNPLQCIMYAFDCFATALTRMIFDEYNYDLMEWRADIELIVQTITSAARYTLAGASWLDDSEKVKLITKINQITYYPGIPNWIMNNSEVDRRTLTVDENVSPLQNVFTILKGNFERYLNLVVLIDDPTLESEPTLDTNANYMRMQIILYLGYLFPPWYHPRYPLAVKYGNIGYIIGHELFHAFDIGNIMEQPNNIKSWLTNCTLKQYYRKVDCLKKQYSSVCSNDQKLCLSGAKTIRENMADLDGLKVSYMAYKFATMTAGIDNPLPGLTDLNGDQLFFLTFGRVRCATNGDLENWFQNRDVHSPDLIRLEMSIRNFEAFSKTFKCEAGSRYDVAQSCSLWVDSNGPSGVY